MQIQIEPILYIDPQDTPPADFCQKCGGALYFPSMECIRCRKYGT